MKILLLTGNLAYNDVKNIIKNQNHEITVYKIDYNVAALITPKIIINQIKNDLLGNLNDFDMILVPGLMNQPTTDIEKTFNIPTFKSTRTLDNLDLLLNNLDKIQLSSTEAADDLMDNIK